MVTQSDRGIVCPPHEETAWNNSTKMKSRDQEYQPFRSGLKIKTDVKLVRFSYLHQKGEKKVNFSLMLIFMKTSVSFSAGH